MSITEAAQLRAQGVPLVLADGTTAQLRFGMDELAEVENVFGSLDEMQAELAKGVGGKMMGSIVKLLRIGLRDPDAGNKLAPQELQTYVDAIGRAFEQAFPPNPATGANGQPPVAPSRGPNYIGAPPSDLGEPTKNFGT